MYFQARKSSTPSNFSSSLVLEGILTKIESGQKMKQTLPEDVMRRGELIGVGYL
jgi:hypothetical protein